MQHKTEQIKYISSHQKAKIRETNCERIAFIAAYIKNSFKNNVYKKN